MSNEVDGVVLGQTHNILVDLAKGSGCTEVQTLAGLQRDELGLVKLELRLLPARLNLKRLAPS